MPSPGAVLAAVCLLGIAACSDSASPSPASGTAPAGAFVARTDAVGREVRLPSHPVRIVSLAPSITESLFALGAGGRVIGVTDRCDFPPEARALPRVGGMTDPSLERVRALSPDLVLVTTEGNRPDFYRRMVEFGLPVFSVDREDASGLEGVFDSVLRIGEAIGEGARAQALVLEGRARMERLVRRVAPFPRVRVLALVWTDPPVAAGRGTFLDGLLHAAGGLNVAAEAGEGWPRLSLEGLIPLAPEVLLVITEGDAPPPGYDRLLALDTIPAVHGGRVIHVSDPEAMRPCLRALDSLEKFARILHPEAWLEEPGLDLP